MFRYIILAFFATPAILTVLAQECSQDEFQCDSTRCIHIRSKCDGVYNCEDESDEPFTCPIIECERVDGSDETYDCYNIRNVWGCKDGSRIPIEAKCDGRFDCPDRSDETHFLCRENFCARNTFRCTYGACVDGMAPCNGIEECADGSDELLPRCRNETLVVDGIFTCNNAQQIPADGHCDGVKNCEDGSDETLQACAELRCEPWHFQCAYGACVTGDAKCDANGVHHCFDGSDETDEICGRSEPAPTSNYCVLPAYPEYGNYSVPGWPGARPGLSFADVSLTYTCETRFMPHPIAVPVCSNGQWHSDIPQCKLFCELTPDPSVTYYCGDRVCNAFELVGTKVFPQCNENYSYNGQLRQMTCEENFTYTFWNHVVTCEPVPKSNCTTSIDSVKVQIQDDDAIVVIINDNVYMYVTGSHYSITLGNSTATVASGKGIEIAKVDNKANTTSIRDISIHVVKDEHPVSADGNNNLTETTDTSISSDDHGTGNDNTAETNEPNLSVNVTQDEHSVTPSDSNPNVTETTVSSSPSDGKASGNDTITVIDEVNVQNGTTTPAPNQSTTEMPTISYSTDKLPVKVLSDAKKEVKENKPESSKFFDWQYVMPRNRA